ncbi:MAG: ATP-binding cassette domain-containing protein [Actinomycetota bacterium]
MSRNDEVAVRFEGVVRTYRTPTGEVRALRDVSAELPRRGISAVVGPSGSGKSSLLRLVAGLDRPTEGSIVVKGIEVGRASNRRGRAVRRSTVGYVFQRPSDNLLAHLTVAEHLRLASRAAEVSDDELVATARALGIVHRLDHRPAELSGGEQQRVAVAQALASGASVVVADEPTAELDSEAAEGVLGRIADLAERDITFVLATHDPSVMSIAGHELALEHGVVAGSDEPRASAEPVEWTALRWPGIGDGDGPWMPAALGGAALRLRGISRSYGDGDESVRAVDRVDLDAAPGEVVALVGRSGSGKTTLLNIAAGWEVPDEGEVERPGGQDPTWSDVAVVPQHLGLMDELSVRENIEYPVRLAGESAARRDLVDDLLEQLGLSSLQRRSPRETSLGEQQRIAVARAVVLGPALIVADEPTAHQDAGSGAAVLRTLGDASLAGSCCVVATHDADVLGAVDRTVRMSDGRFVDG